MSQPRSPRQRVTKIITVPGNFLLGCQQFNRGQYFECHESFEEIWQEEQGDVRDLYKGLIQVAAAFVHITRENCVGARRLLTTALGYLEPYRAEGAMGFDVEAICLQGERSLAQVEELCPGGLERFDWTAVPHYGFDEEQLANEARRWSAWGFDRNGNALPMEIDVVE